MAVDAIVWISGASSGLGAALAATVPYPDAHVFDISRSGGTPGTEHVPADLADPAAWRALEAHWHVQLADFTGSRAVFVHAAGTLEPIGFAGEVDSAAYQREVLLNAAAPLVLGNAFLSALAASAFSGEADLVMMSSGAAGTVYPGWSGYGPAKAAVNHWVRTVGAEQEARGGGCRVLSIGPGVVATGMQERIRDSERRDFPKIDKFLSLHQEGQLAAPQDAAAAVWSIVTGAPGSGTVTDVRS